MTAAAIAIDFGTTRTKVAYFDAERGEPRLVELGRDIRAIVPSIFHVSSDGERRVGDDAQDMLDTDPDGIIIGLKKEIHKLGKKHLGRGRPIIDRVELASTLFCFIREGCRDEVFHKDFVRCVLTVPVTFEEQKRECIRRAAELAGFREIRIVDEPVSAAKHWLTTSGQHIADTVVVCDVGGGTTDLALLRYRHGHVAPIADVPPDGFELGGNDVDESILESVLEQDQAGNADGSCRSAFLAKLRRVRESSTRVRGEHIPLTLGNIKLVIPRTVIDERTREFVERVAKATLRFLDHCRTIANVQDSPILLVGGASRLPGLKDALERLARGRVYQWNYSDYATVLGAVEHPVSDPATASVAVTIPAPLPIEAPSLLADEPIRAPSTYGEPKSLPVPTTVTKPGAEARASLVRAQELLDQAQQLANDASPEHQAEIEQHLDAALRHAQAACDLEPTWADAFRVKAEVLSQQSESTLAVAAMTICLRLNPEHSDAWGLRGRCKFASGDFAGARHDLDEQIRRTPSATWDVLRAAACARGGDAAVAVADLRSAIESTSEDVSRASLCAIAGLLLYRQLEDPAESIPLYGQALAAISVDVPFDESQEFTAKCEIFDLLDSMIVSPHQVVNPVASVQRHLWQAIMAIRGQCDRSAVTMFFKNCGSHDVADDQIWQTQPEFCRYRADICAADGDGNGAVTWLKRLWERCPEYDVRTIRKDPGIQSVAGHAGLRELLEVKLSCEEDHGALLNQVAITNESAFRLTAIEVSISVTRKDGKQGAPIQRRLDVLAPGASHEWEGVFQDGGWFGRNIRSVSIGWKCAQGVSSGIQTPVIRPLSRSGAGPNCPESSSSAVRDVQVRCPHCQKYNVIASSNLGIDIRCIHCRGTIEATRASSGTSQAAEVLDAAALSPISQRLKQSPLAPKTDDVRVVSPKLSAPNAALTPAPPSGAGLAGIGEAEGESSPSTAATKRPETEGKAARLMPTVSADIICGMIGDGHAEQAFDSVNQALTIAPNERLFDLWCACATLVADAGRLLIAARGLHHARKGDVWSSCCLAEALNALRRQAEAKSVLDPFFADAKLNKFFPLHFEHLLTLDATRSQPYQRLLERLLKRKPDHSTLLALKAATTPMLTEKQELLDRALKSNPYDLRALFLDVVSEGRVGNFQKIDFAHIARHVDTMKRIACNHCFTRLARAYLLIRSRYITDAKVELDVALADPRVSEQPDLASMAFLWRSYCHREEEEQAARTDLDQCLLRAPDNTEALEARGSSLFEAGSWREAIRDFDRLLNAVPQHLAALEHRGYCRLFIGQHDAARTDFQTLASLDSGSTAARTGLAAAMIHHAFSQGADIGDAASRFYVWPDLPEDKLRAVLDSYSAGHANENTTILLIYDDTFWRGAADGFAITESQLLWHDAAESCQARQLSSIRNVRYKAGLLANKLCIDSQTISLTYVNEAFGQVLAKLLMDLSNEQRWIDEGAMMASMG